MTAQTHEDLIVYGFNILIIGLIGLMVAAASETMSPGTGLAVRLAMLGVTGVGAILITFAKLAPAREN